MAFDKPTRNRLQKFVAEAREALIDEFVRQLQATYGLDPKTGSVAEINTLRSLDNRQRETARLLRETLAHYVAGQSEGAHGARTKQSLERMVREQAFTVMNRLAALRMAEARGFLMESVAKGHTSKGFQLYRQLAGGALGETGDAYHHYLFSLFDEVSVDLAVLFDRNSTQSLLFPRESALSALLGLLNAPDLEALWAEDETIGWIYQYYNDPDERKKMRKESAAPRNSRELAVRNQFFTPRYVVEFLTDNTLGRIWYEMSGGATSLKDQCRYLVRRPTEIFLAEGETAPETPDRVNFSQEELLKQPVHIPHRPLKDPREIRLLDPACGSMHFGLYAFDLFETIYEEAWDNGSCPALVEAYASRDEFLQDAPRLIIEHNIHGIDIDPRAVQIAGLSLWLRAQKAWQARGVKPADRPRVRRSNIVCAEPMPGSPEMLQDFVATLKPDLLGELVKTVFDKMQLAGEAGSLLKIEEEIRTAIDTARGKWKKLQDKAPELPLEGVTGDFFDSAEERIYTALRAYAEQADADSYQRRLFADDAARGFAFIDLCRKRYDAVVMNPPFGLGIKSTEKYLKRAFPSSAGDEVAATFYTRSLELLSSLGRIGEISSRTCFYLSSTAAWRTDQVFTHSTIDLFADLGDGVLDDALNETAAYVVQKIRIPQWPSRFGMFHREKNQADAILDLATTLSRSDCFCRKMEDFEVLPDRPICYWISDSFVNALSKFTALGDGAADVQMGLAPRDEFRFSRLWWEVPADLTGPNNLWVGYAKGGELSAYYSDVELLLNARNDLREIKVALNMKYPYLNGNLSWVLHPENDYFMPGLTFGQRTSFLRMSVLPKGNFFSVAGKAVFGKTQSTRALIQALNTPSAQYLTYLRRERLSLDPQFQEGDVVRLPWPDIDERTKRSFQDWGAESIRIVRSVAEFDEIDHSFRCLDVEGRLVNQRNSSVDAITEIEDSADAALANLLSLSSSDQRFIDAEIRPKWKSRVAANWFTPDLSRDRILFSLGAAFGRWDIRYSAGERQPPELPDPFDPLPICPPGMLQNAEGLPAAPKDVPADYPLRISWPGILVDDENHPEDIVARVRETIEVIWKDRAESIEQEACEILGVKTLRDYFRRPTAFFADHLKRYSKSRRQAPIYWPLSTKSGSYTLWLYYHRLTAQTLYACVNDFVEPKIKSVKADHVSMRSQLARSAKEEKEFARLTDLQAELEDLRDELLRIAKFWKPNLNDGVQITAAPLWACFGLKPWQSTLKDTWKKLEQGDYDWAHLACSIWPERVLRKCHLDRSLAIAHGVDTEFWQETEVPGGRGRKVQGELKSGSTPKQLSSGQLDDLIHQLTRHMER